MFKVSRTGVRVQVRLNTNEMIAPSPHFQFYASIYSVIKANKVVSLCESVPLILRERRGHVD